MSMLLQRAPLWANYWCFADVKRLELVKWLAVVAMVCDHLAISVLPDYQWLRQVGTFAFPAFFLAFGVGLARTADAYGVARRLLIPAGVAQAAWYVIDPGHSINVLFVCAFVAFSLHALRYRSAHPLYRLAGLGLYLLLPLAALGLSAVGVEGGIFGFALIAGAFLAARGSHWLLLASCALWLVLLPSWGFLAGVLAVYFMPYGLRSVPRVRGLLSWVYAGHLLLLAVAMRALGEGVGGLL